MSNKLLQEDYNKFLKYGEKASRFRNLAVKYIYYVRRAQFSSNRYLLLWYRWKLKGMKIKYGLEIDYRSKIGGGLYLGHPYGITVNPEAVIGENCNLHKNVTIGAENRGKRKGAPKIGNSVWIGANSTIVGDITIGDDVLIAPNSFVNRDVPSHCIVFGNPCIIKLVTSGKSATEGYI
jgi:serine O-acetyltransferase